MSRMRPERGSALWRSLHEFAWSMPEMLSADDQRDARAWLADFARIVGREACECHTHWQRIASSCPPDLTSRRAFYWWTVAVHDWVNQRLGKPLAAPLNLQRFPSLIALPF